MPFVFIGGRACVSQTLIVCFGSEAACEVLSRYPIQFACHQDGIRDEVEVARQVAKILKRVSAPSPNLKERPIDVERSKARYRVLRRIYRQVALGHRLDRPGPSREERTTRFATLAYGKAGVSSPHHAKVLIPQHTGDTLLQNSPLGRLYGQPGFRKQLSLL